MMPFTTSSPYRFRRPGQGDPRPPDQDARPHLAQQQQQQQPLRASSSRTGIQPQAQFATTPRFTARQRRPQQTQAPSPPPLPSFAEVLRAAGRLREDVEDATEADSRGGSGDEDDEEMLDSAEPGEVLPTTELYPNNEGHNDETKPHVSLPFSPKRRRLDDHEHITVPTEDTAHLFQTPQHPPPTFRHPLPSPPPRAPSFIRPSTAPSEPPSHPLPEAFSPHRRGQKFLPGGMASTVQGWIVEAGRTALQNQTGRVHAFGDADGAWDLKGAVLKVQGSGSGSGPWLTRLMIGDGNEKEVRVILAGSGGGGGGAAGGKRTANEIKVGTVIGVRAPTWTVVLEGREWVVGVDWKALTSPP